MAARRELMMRPVGAASAAALLLVLGCSSESSSDSDSDADLSDQPSQSTNPAMPGAAAPVAPGGSNPVSPAPVPAAPVPADPPSAAAGPPAAPPVAAPPVVACTPVAAGVLDFDELYGAVRADLAAADADDAPFFRYISLSDRLQGGDCWESAIERGRQGLTKAMNMLSIRASLGDVEPIDDDNLLYRIDLRDFDWNRAISVNGQDFTDVWEAVAANNPYALEFVGDDADDAKADAVTDFPLMFADQMMDVALIGNLYYAIIGIDVAQPLAAFIAVGLGVDEVNDVIDGEVIRAGTTQSRVSRQDRLAQRHELGVRAGILWQSFDFEDAAGNDSIFEDPFGFQPGAREIIFTLPNGMLAFAIADAADAIVETSDILLDSSRDDFLTVTAVSCSNCHAQGFLPVVDEVGPTSLANARELGLNQDELLGLEFLYIPPPLFAQLVASDSAAFYQRSLQQLGVTVAGTDPVAEAVLRFDDDVRLADAAGDLGLSPEELEDSLGLLDPTLALLDEGSLDRDDFTDLFEASLCALSTTLENQPDPVACQIALDLLGD